MSYSVTATFNKEQAKLSGSFPIDLYVVNASISGNENYYFSNLNQNIYGWNINNSGEVGATKTIYTGLPMERGDVSSNIDGELSDLTISIPNVDRTIESLIQNRNYLRGCSIYALTAFAKHLPSEDNGKVWYKLDEGMGYTTAHDSSGNGNNLTLYGSPTWVDGLISGKCIDLNGSSQYGLSPIISGISGDVWMSVVVTPDVIADGVFRAPISLYTTSGGVYYGWYLRFGNLENNRIDLVAGVGTGTQYSTIFTKSTPFVAGTSYKIVVTHISGVFRVYVDGVQIGSDWSQAVSYSGSDIFTVGRRAADSATYYFDGKIDEVRFGVGTLTENQRLSLYYSNTLNSTDAAYIGEDPDHHAVIKEKYYIDGTSSNDQVVTFSCKSKLSVKNIIIPGRTFSNDCAWARGIGAGYLGTECDPTNSISATTFSTCDGTLDSCRARSNIARFGGFTSVPKKVIII